MLFTLSVFLVLVGKRGFLLVLQKKKMELFENIRCVFLFSNILRLVKTCVFLLVGDSKKANGKEHGDRRG